MKGLLAMPSVKSAVEVGFEVERGFDKEAIGSLPGEGARIPVPLTRQGTQYLAKQLASPDVEAPAADAQLLAGGIECACQDNLLIAGPSKTIFHLR
jgi:hypothetical protein